MTEELASIIWGELKRYINTVDRADAAENLLGILIDNDCDPDTLKSAFKGDSDFKKALADYLVGDEQEEETEDTDEDEEDCWED